MNEGKYEFTLSGKFEEVIGNDASIQFEGEPITGKREANPISQDDEPNLPLEAVGYKPQPGDPAQVNPLPPVVTINIPKENNMPKILGATC